MTISTSINSAIIIRYQLGVTSHLHTNWSASSSPSELAPQSPPLKKKKAALQEVPPQRPGSSVPSDGSRDSSFTEYTVYIPLKMSCCLTLAPLVCFCTQTVALAGQERLHRSLARGAGSPSSGSWRSYTTTLMTYQHFTHIFPTTIKTFWTCMAPSSHTTAHGAPGPDPPVPPSGPDLQQARPAKCFSAFFFATWFKNCGKFNFYFAL